MKPDKEWVIELEQTTFNRWVIVGPAWMNIRTPLDKSKTYKTHLMRETTLDKCIEAMVFWCNYPSAQQYKDFDYKSRLRARNMKTGELIPVEALGL